MKAPISFSLQGQQLWLTPLKAIYWEDEQALIVADLHFGKTGHFRKAGIAVPQEVYKQDLQRLFALVQHFQPRELIMVGDFFHSVQNKESNWFARWRMDHPTLRCTLVKGNHDILQESWYKEQSIDFEKGVYIKGAFSFAHEWKDVLSPEHTPYCFTGHIHPGIRLSGGGRQSLRLPCYYFGKQYAVLPAFGDFTGLAILEPQPADRIFVIANQQVISIK